MLTDGSEAPKSKINPDPSLAVAQERWFMGSLRHINGIRGIPRMSVTGRTLIRSSTRSR